MSPAERAQRALGLIESLGPTEEGDIEATWRLEAEAGLAQIERSETQAVPGGQVLESTRRRLR